jgi:uncharacterized protein YacL
MEKKRQAVEKKIDAPQSVKSAPAQQTAAFTRALAAEIVKNLTSIGQFTTRPFRRNRQSKSKIPSFGENPILVDTSILIDGRIVPIVSSGFFTGTLLIPQFVLSEVQHIADSADSVRRVKGRRGLDVANKLKSQKINDRVKTKVINEDESTEKEVDHKLVKLAKKYSMRLITLDFNLAQLARAQSVKVMNVNDLAQAMKVALVPGEEGEIRIVHEGKERDQGVGYLDDGTMVVVEGAKNKVGLIVRIAVQKVHQTPAGQLFFAKLV